MKIFSNNTYLLLIDEEAEILCRNKEILLSKDESLLCEITEVNHRQHFRGINIVNDVKISISHHQINDFYKVVAYYPLTKKAKELDLPLLPNPFEGINIRKLAQESWRKNKEEKGHYFKKDIDEQILMAGGYICGFEEGYKAAQSNKQFSLEDIKKAIRDSVYTIDPELLGTDEYNIEENRIIQSLSTQQLPVNFIPDYENKCWCLKPMSGGCFECTKILKTIKNSEGKEELVGNYQY